MISRVMRVGRTRALTTIVAIIVAIAILVPLRTAHASNLTSSTGGPVSVEFVSASANFINSMSYVDASGAAHGLFNTEQSRIGTRFNLGTFPSGTTFRFMLLARTSSGAFIWRSDPARNSDGKIICE